jgi:ParB family chromosome partitioning protein
LKRLFQAQRWSLAAGATTTGERNGFTRHTRQGKCIGPAKCRLDDPAGSATETADAIEKTSGCVVGSYKEPLGGRPYCLRFCPIDAVEPTLLQRDLSDAHHNGLPTSSTKSVRVTLLGLETG